jgi:AbrB family looped-hinge helix DNA binding protein
MAEINPIIVQLSTKGQLVIPHQIRKSLKLRAGTEFYVRVEDDKIILEPLAQSPALEGVYGRYASVDLLSDLEAEHHQELQREKTSASDKQ